MGQAWNPAVLHPDELDVLEGIVTLELSPSELPRRLRPDDAEFWEDPEAASYEAALQLFQTAVGRMEIAGSRIRPYALFYSLSLGIQNLSREPASHEIAYAMLFTYHSIHPGQWAEKLEGRTLPALTEIAVSPSFEESVQALATSVITDLAKLRQTLPVRRALQRVHAGHPEPSQHGLLPEHRSDYIGRAAYLALRDHFMPEGMAVVRGALFGYRNYHTRSSPQPIAQGAGHLRLLPSSSPSPQL